MSVIPSEINPEQIQTHNLAPRSPHSGEFEEMDTEVWSNQKGLPTSGLDSNRSEQTVNTTGVPWVKLVGYDDWATECCLYEARSLEAGLFKDFLVSYNKLSEMCFIDCVNDFTTRSVKAAEEKCAVNCTEKFLKMNQRISQRFQEYQIIANENALAATQKMGGK